MRVQQMLLMGLVAWACSWVASFKILALLYGGGPLSPDMHPAVFAYFLAFPIELDTAPESRSATSTRAPVLAVRLLIWGAICVLVLTPLLAGIVSDQWAPRIELDMSIHCAQSSHGFRSYASSQGHARCHIARGRTTKHQSTVHASL